MEQDTWSETALVTISAQGAGNDVEFACLTETVEVDIGDKDFDIINTLCGGRMVKFTPQAETTITLEAYPVEAGTDTGTTGKGFFDLMHTSDAGPGVQQIEVDHERNKYRVALLWTDKSGAASATEALATLTDESGLRIVAADGYFTSVKPSYTDGVLKYTVMFKVPAFDKAKAANVMMESTDGTADMAALAAYTSSAKGW